MQPGNQKQTNPDKEKPLPPALLPQDPTVCQTLPSNPNQQRSRTPTPKGKNVRTNNRSVPPGTYPLIFHP